MEPYSKYEQVLIRYLLNECSADEKRDINEWINASESNRLYLQDLANVLKLVAVNEEVNKIDIDSEWQHFQKLKNSAPPQSLYIDRAATQEEPIAAERTNGRLYRLVIAAAIAASLIFIVYKGVALINKAKTEKESLVKDNNKAARKIDASMVVLLHEENTSVSARLVSLPDGSQVNLYPASELTYREPSGGNKREVLLEGRADFKVAKDKTRPFTVFSGDISTTALGTQFTVTAMRYEKQIVVRLHEGKIVIKPVAAFNKMKDVYLVPGQELIYDMNSGIARVRSFGRGNEIAGKNTNRDKLSTENPAIPNYDKRSWFMFNNQSLSEIFDALQGMFHVRIQYSKGDISKMYFIGTFDKSDSVEYILKKIAFINNLEVIKNNNTYTIQKQVLQQKN